MRWIGIEELEEIALGASLLGAGGGGDPYIGKLMAVSAVQAYGPARLIEAEELADDALVVPIGMMGAPTVLAEKGIGSHDVEDLHEMVCEMYGREIDAFMCTEAGGVNSMMPLTASARTGIPLVDADGMGRAFPELQMETMALGGVTASPCALVDEKGNRVVFRTADNHWTERLARAVTVESGGNVSTCMYIMDGKTCKRYGVLGTMSRCQELGRIIRGAKNETDSAGYFFRETGAFPLFSGKISDLERTVKGGFNLGSVTISGTGDCQGETARVIFQNENLAAYRGEELLATVPDLIALVDSATFLPVTTDRLKYGKRVLVVGLPCNPLWRTPEGLELVGPRYFGLDCDYVPLEERARRRENV